MQPAEPTTTTRDEPDAAADTSPEPLDIPIHEILGALPEQTHEDIARIAASLCNAPHAVVSLVAADGERLKVHGESATDAAARDFALAVWSLVGPQRLVAVADTMEDPRFASHPQVTGEPHVRFCAGVQLTTEQGQLGTMFVLDSEPRHLYPDQLNALSALGRQVVNLIPGR